MKYASGTRINSTKVTMGTLGLKAASAQLSNIIDTAEKDQLSYREFMDKVLLTETAARNEKHRLRNYAAAHFPPAMKTLDEFNTAELESGITPTQLIQLKDLAWVDACTNIFFLGPPGLGKTMLALGLGLEAINQGYTVCFERMVNLIEILDTAKNSRTSAFRLRKIRKCSVIIIDEIGFVPISKAQANAFFSFVSDVYEHASFIFTTNKQVGEWAEILGDPVLATALLDRLLYNAKCFSFRGESFRIKHPLDNGQGRD